MGPLVLTQFPGLMVFTSISRLWEMVHTQGNYFAQWFFQWSCMDVRVGL